MIAPSEKTNFVCDGVPNAGDANNEIRAGSQNATLFPAMLRVTEEAAGVVEPTSQISSSADGSNLQAAFTAAPVTAGPSTAKMTPDPGAADSIIELFESAVGKPRDEWRIEEANKRQDIIKTYLKLTGEGMTKADAVKQIGIGYATIWRWLKEFEKTGYNGLLPKTQNCGRDSWLDKLKLKPDELEGIINAVKGISLDTGSVTSALRVFANSDQCPEALANVILDPTRCSKHAIPRSIRSAVKVSKMANEAHRGPRNLSLKGIYIPRKMDVLPGDVFTADDTTPIWAWWVPWRECEDYPYGVKLLQGQFIPVMDVASQAAITGVIIAREKSSYRAADIWNLFGHTFDEIGLPRLGFQLERGSWEANLIRGQEVVYETRQHEKLGEVSEATASRRIGGLRQLPCNAHDQLHNSDGSPFTWPKTLQTFTSYLPKSKSIEAFFNRSQALEGTLWGALGRDQMRRPFEKTKKLFQACQNGSEDPRNHFLSHTEIAARISGLMEYLNNEPMEGEVFKGIPRINFEASTKERPLWMFKGIPELENLRWLYRREWTVLTITGGWARIRLTHPISGERYSLFYNNPAFAQMEGELVAVYYDRENFQDNAQIVAAAKFTVNGTTYEPGDHICEAQYVDRVGAFLGTDRTGIEVAKQWRNAVMSTYMTFVKHAPSRQLPPEIAQRRAEAKSIAQSPQSTVIDHRPTAAPVQTVAAGAQNPFAVKTAEQLTKQQNRVSRQAALTARLRSLGGLE